MEERKALSISLVLILLAGLAFISPEYTGYAASGKCYPVTYIYNGEPYQHGTDLSGIIKYNKLKEDETKAKISYCKNDEKRVTKTVSVSQVKVIQTKNGPVVAYPTKPISPPRCEEFKNSFGEVVGVISEGDMVFMNHCDDGDNLIQFKCDANGDVKEKTIPCSFGCGADREGYDACLNPNNIPPTPQKECVDTDDGKDTNVYGETYLTQRDNMLVVDACDITTPEEDVIENWCARDKTGEWNVKTQTLKCEVGKVCGGGACQGVTDAAFIESLKKGINQEGYCKVFDKGKIGWQTCPPGYYHTGMYSDDEDDYSDGHGGDIGGLRCCPFLA